MPVYVDDLRKTQYSEYWPYKRACSLRADTPEELYAFARQLGVEASWFEQGTTHAFDRYDLPSGKRQQAIEAGAIPLTSWQLAEKVHEWKQWKAHLNIKHLLTDEILEPASIKLLAQEIARKLKRQSLFDDPEIIANLEQVDNQEEFNSILEDLYIECNRVRIWVR